LAILAATGGATLPQAPDRDARLEIAIAELRSRKGLIHLCLTRRQASFPDCRKDRDARRASVNASRLDPVSFLSLEPGTYALSLVHDENGNGQLDTFAAIPREGFGFSGGSGPRLGPARFREAAFIVRPGANRQTIRVRYVL
jgi:uncharacterized protein (DUF2141 family)